MITKNGQSIFDIILQTSGGLDGIKDFLSANTGIGLEQSLIPTTFVQSDILEADIKTKLFFETLTPVSGETFTDTGLKLVLVNDFEYLQDGNGNFISYG